MPLSRFSRYVLRTTDVAAATAFYDVVLGRRRDDVIPLQQAAIDRGARPLWLGHIGVRDVGGAEAVAGRFVERGAMRIGPASAEGDIVLRDPGGAILALTDASAESDTDVVWHQLNTRERDVATANYAALFGWSFAEQLDLGDFGCHQYFGFGTGESTIGVFSDGAGRPQVHTHWLFFFAVRSLDVAVDRVLSHGGSAIGPMDRNRSAQHHSSVALTPATVAGKPRTRLS